MATVSTDAAAGFDGRDFARTLTTEPGVYRMLGAGDQVLYVGKARNLKARVESYFARGAHDARITSMIMQVQRMEVMVTRTEAEALLLEPLGFPLATALGIMIMAWLLGAGLRAGLVSAITISLGLFVIFDQLLGLHLPMLPESFS